MSVAAVIYAAKSTADVRGSIPTQIDDCLAAIERGGRELAGAPQTDEGFSGYTGSRGPGLERAKEMALAAVVSHGEAELWVQHSDRLARGDSRGHDGAAHLIEHVLWARRAGVQLRSVQDDAAFGDLIHAVLTGERNHDDSARKSAATRSGKRRRFERGLPMGGPVPDGFRLVVERNGDTRYEVVDDRAELVRGIFERADAGASPAVIARALNAAGHRTAVRTSRRADRTYGGRPWTRRRVYDTLTTPLYAGLVVYGERGPEQEVRPADPLYVPALVERELFDRVQARMTARNPSPEHDRRGGRPPLRYALGYLVRCQRCGESMYTSTSTHKRVDGTHARRYVCGNVRTCTGVCDAPPVDAERVDRAVVAHLDGFFLDFEAWRRDVMAGRAGEREGIERKLAAEHAELATVDRRMQLVRGDYVRQLEAGSERAATVAADTLADLDRQRETVERRVRRLDGALTALPVAPPVDALLDFYNDLGRAVRGEDAASVDLGEVNARLRDVFEVFWMDTLRNGRVLVTPVLREDAVPAWGDSYVAISGMSHADALELRDFDDEPIGMVVTGEERVVPPVLAVTTAPDDGPGAKPQSTFV